MKLYNDFAKDKFHSHNPPVKGLKAAIFEYEEDGYLTLRLYRHNYETYDGAQKQKINVWANSVLEDLSKIAPISLEVFP